MYWLIDWLMFGLCYGKWFCLLTDNSDVLYIGHWLWLSGVRCAWWKWRTWSRLPSDLDVNIIFLHCPVPISSTSVTCTNGGLRLPEEILLSPPARLHPDCRVTTSKPEWFGGTDAGTTSALSIGWPQRLPSSTWCGVLLSTRGMR